MDETDAVAVAHGLVQAHSGLRTLRDAAEWRQQANAALAALAADEPLNAQLMLQQAEALHRAEQAARARPWYVRLFTRPPQNLVQARAERAAGAARQHELKEHRAGLLERLDSLPTTAEQRKQMVEQLKETRAELVAAKREVAYMKREVRAEARMKSVAVGTAGFFKPARGAVADARRAIAYTREKALQPLQASGNTVELQLIDIDRRLAFLRAM